MERVRLQVLRDHFTSEHYFMSEPIENYVTANETLNLDKNRPQKRHRTFRRDREPSRIPIRTLQPLSNKSRKVTEFVNVCVVFKNACFFFF